MLAFASTAVRLYRTLGGTLLQDTVGDGIEDLARRRSAGANVVAGGLVLAGVGTPAWAVDEHARRWHVFAWDLWFLVWGAVLAVAVVRCARSTGHRSGLRRGLGRSPGAGRRVEFVRLGLTKSTDLASPVSLRSPGVAGRRRLRVRRRHRGRGRSRRLRHRRGRMAARFANSHAPPLERDVVRRRARAGAGVRRCAATPPARLGRPGRPLCSGRGA